MGRDEKVTYVTLSADDPAVVAGFDRSIATVQKALGRTCPLYIGGVPRETQATTLSTSPNDTRIVVARAHTASRQDFDDAIAYARSTFPAWRARPWSERAAILARAAHLIRERRFELSTWLIYEMGKNRLEALGEIEETADLIDYYIDEMKRNDGFVCPMGRLNPADTNTSVLRPYGVWAVISPWNFPYALLAAPVAAALLAGNTVVAKPSSETPLAGGLIAEIFNEAGLPPGTLSMLTGPGRLVGEVLLQNSGVDGLTFTGSYDVGFHQLYRHFSERFPRPCIVEMGGKNPAIVMGSADLERAVGGVYRSAFGMNGHKCSACSRVYVHRSVFHDFVSRLTEMASKAAIGNPLERTTFIGPLATAGGYHDYQRYAEIARHAGAVHYGGETMNEGALAHGHYVRPTILVGLPESHELVKTELFVPMVHVAPIDTLDEALAKANDTDFGLTAGFFSGDPREIDSFFDRIEAGVTYVNRAAGATTGAWPGVQPFGGWKGSGSTGKAIGGHYTMQCYLREQSRTLTA